MKFTCNVVELKKAIQIVRKAVATIPDTPVLSGIQIISQENGTLNINAMDMNIAMNCIIDAKVETPGDILVPSKHLGDLLASMDNEEVTFSRADSKNDLEIITSSGTYTLNLMDEGDYPPFPNFVPEKSFKLADEVANDLIKKTIFACSTEESRPIFTGILFEKKGNVINCVGTNTHRLALKSTTVETGLNDDFSLIIPSRVLKEIIANINPSVPQDIEFGLFNRQIMVKIDNVTIISGLIEGKFPDYNRVIPASFDIHCQVDKRKLLGSIKRVALFSTQTDYSLVKITIKSNQIVVQSGNSDFGTAEELVECKTTGDEMKVAFNAKYLLDILKIVESDEVLMELNSSLSPVSIKQVDDESYQYIVTPVRVLF